MKINDGFDNTNKKNHRGLDLRRKVVLSFVLVGIMLISVTSILMYTLVDTKNEYNFFIDSLIKKKSLTKSINISMLEARRSEKDFLLRFDLKYPDRVKEKTSEMLGFTESIKLLDKKIAVILNNQNYTEVSEASVKKLSESINAYQHEFSIATDLYIKKGLDSDSGLQGSFRTAAHDLEDLINLHSSDSSMVKYLMLRRNEKDYLLRGTAKYIDRVRSGVEDMTKALSYAPLPKTVKQEMTSSLNIYLDNFEELVSIDNDIVQAVANLRDAVHEMEPVLVQITEDMSLILDEESIKLHKRVMDSLKLGLVIAIVAIIVEILLAFVISGSISKPMKIIMRDTARLETGDLSKSIDYSKKDELGNIAGYVNKSIESFRLLISNTQSSSAKSMTLTESIAASATETAAATTEIDANISSINKKIVNLTDSVNNSEQASGLIKSSIETLNQLIQDQSAAVEESTTAIEEITSTIQSVTKIAQDRGQSAETLKKVTENGEQQVDTTNKLITEVAGIAGDIINVTEIINGIAAQTNLLAMNAAIEAAHAGDAGKGFAVVADEIRKLAESSAQNAKQINSLLSEVDSRIESASTASKLSIESFTGVKSEVLSFINALAEIVSSMTEMEIGSREVLTSTELLSRIMSEVSANTEDIVENVDGITSSMGTVSILTSETSNGISEIQIAINEIDKASVDLSDRCVENEDVMKELSESLNEFTV